MPRKHKQLTIEAPEDLPHRINVIMGHMMWHWEAEMIYDHAPEHYHKGFNHDHAKV